MRRAHDRYEALAGAIALGEATAAEAAEFGAHCATCRHCTDDAETLRTEVATAVAIARELETWRPQIGDRLLRRIDAERSRATERTANLLGCAIVLSLALNAALATGIAQRTAHALAPVIARVLPIDALVAGRGHPVLPQGEEANATR